MGLEFQRPAEGTDRVGPLIQADLAAGEPVAAAPEMVGISLKNTTAIRSPSASRPAEKWAMARWLYASAKPGAESISWVASRIASSNFSRSIKLLEIS